jgi:hypothetical protein
VRVTDNGVPTKIADQSLKVKVIGRLEFLSTVRTGGQLNITWRAIPGRSYRLSRSDVLPTQQWTVVGENVLADGDTATRSVPIATSIEKHFFKVELVDE